LFIVAKIMKFKLKTAIINNSCAEDERITVSHIFIILLVVFIPLGFTAFCT